MLSFYDRSMKCSFIFQLCIIFLQDAEREAEKAADKKLRKEKQKHFKMQKNKQNRKIGKQQRFEEKQEIEVSTQSVCHWLRFI